MELNKPSAHAAAETKNRPDPAQQTRLRNIMTPEVVTIAPESTLFEAARIMGEKRIGSLIVVKYKTPVGIITERDLLREVVAREINLEKDWLVGGASIKDEKVEEFMSYPLKTIHVDASIKEAARMMIENRIRRLE